MAGPTHIPASRWKSGTEAPTARRRPEFAGGRRFELVLCAFCISVVRKWASLPPARAEGPNVSNKPNFTGPVENRNMSNKPNCRRAGRGPECVKQTQLLEGQMEANSLLCKGLDGIRPVLRPRKQSQCAELRLLRRYASRNDNGVPPPGPGTDPLVGAVLTGVAAAPILPFLENALPTAHSHPSEKGR